MKSDIRKIVVTVEETHRESGKSINPVTRKAAAVAVIAGTREQISGKPRQDRMDRALYRSGPKMPRTRPCAPASQERAPPCSLPGRPLSLWKTMRAWEAH